MNQRNKDKKKVLFIVPSLMRGGMENMLVVVANIIVKYAEVTIYNLGSHDEAMVRKLNPKIHYWELWSPCNNLYHSKISDILEGNFRLFPSSIWYCIHSGRYIHKKVVKEHFDVVIFDAPPSLIVADALILARLVDFNILVCAQNTTRMEDLNKSKMAIENVGGKVAGVVLNKVQVTTKRYENSYYYGEKLGRQKPKQRR